MLMNRGTDVATPCPARLAQVGQRFAATPPGRNWGSVGAAASPSRVLRHRFITGPFASLALPVQITWPVWPRQAKVTSTVASPAVAQVAVQHSSIIASGRGAFSGHQFSPVADVDHGCLSRTPESRPALNPHLDGRDPLPCLRAVPVVHASARRASPLQPVRVPRSWPSHGRCRPRVAVLHSSTIMLVLAGPSRNANPALPALHLP